MVTRGFGVEGMDSDCLMGMGFLLGGDENVLKLDCGDSCTTL